jgi:hypothetical protein
MSELTRMKVDEYAKNKGWDWLRVTFKEEAIPLNQRLLSDRFPTRAPFLD